MDAESRSVLADRLRITVPDLMKNMNQWLVWRLAPDPKNPDKQKKIPYYVATGKPRSGTMGSPDDRAQMVSFTAAVNALEGSDRWDGIGIAIMPENGLTILDFDNCIHNGIPDERLKPLYANTYTETSVSGGGLHSIYSGRYPQSQSRDILPSKNEKPSIGLDIFSDSGFVTVNGDAITAHDIAPIGAVKTHLDRITATPLGSPPQHRETRSGRLNELYQTDPIAVWLKEKNAITGYSSDGGIYIPCPFRDEHTKPQGKTDTTYYLPHTGGFPSPKIRCFHTTCAKRKTSDFLEKMGYPSPDPDKEFQRILEAIKTEKSHNRLCNDLMHEIESAPLPPPLKTSLRKQIAKKVGVSVTALIKTAEGKKPEPDHREIALKTAEAWGKEDLLFDPPQKRFMAWDGMTWGKFHDEIIEQAIHEALDELGQPIKAKTVRDVSSVLKALQTIRQDIQWNAPQPTIPFLNGTLKWEPEPWGEWVLHPHRREDYRTAVLPHKWNPDAQCPQWDHFLNDIFSIDGDKEEKIKTIQEMIGYTITTETRFEKFIFLVGNGANGKTVLMNVLKHLIGSRNYRSLTPDGFRNRFQLGALEGALANICGEIPAGSELADGPLKQIISGECLTCEHKNRDPFEMVPTCTLWFAGNHLPSLRDFSDAVFRRTIILRFNRKYEGKEKDTLLSGKLQNEAGGIIRQCLEAYGNVLIRGDFTIPTSSTAAIDRWRIETDQIRLFLESDGIELNPLHEIPRSKLYDIYQNWARDSGIMRAVNKMNFIKRITAIDGITEGRCTSGADKGKRSFIGVGFVSKIEW